MTNNKQYLISFLATMSGDKLVMTKLKSLEKATGRQTKVTNKAAVATGRWDRSLMNVAKRALLVAPVWLLLRSVIMGVVSTVRDMVQANVALNEQMARIKTVVSATSESIDSDMATIRSAILEMATSTTAPLVDLAKTFYFLRTSNLDTEEALAAFPHTVNLAIGTMNDLASTGRTVAGIYNTMNKYMEENLTISEKFRKIADGLAYTYATQEVQMSELLQSYIKLAPYVGGLKEGWTEIITILGFLNTKQLKAGRTGRLLGRSFLQLTKNSKKLAHIFGIVFDPNQPMSFLETLKTINNALNVQGKLTATQADALQKIFATRGAVPIRLLLDELDELIELIDTAGTDMDGFAKRMSDIMQRTIKGQMQRTRNILAVMANTFFSAAAGTGDFVGVLESLNNSLERGLPTLKSWGLHIGWITDNIANVLVAYQDLNESLKMTPAPTFGHKIIETMFPFLKFKEAMTKLKGAKWVDLDIKSYEEFAKLQDKAVQKAKERQELQAKYKSTNEIINEAIVDNLKQQKTEEKNIIALMKIRGASAKEIAEFQLENFNELSKWMNEEERDVERLVRINNNLNAEYKERIDSQKQSLTHNEALHKLYGADAVEIAKLNYEIQKILFGEEDITRTLKAKLKLEREILLAKRGQYKYTSDEAKMMAVYKKYGEDVSRALAKVITGEREPKKLKGEEYEAFQEFFPKRAEGEGVRKFYEDEQRWLKDLMEYEENRERKRALAGARGLKRIPTPTKEQIRIELEKITLPEPMEIKVKAEVKVNVDETKIEKIVREAFENAMKSPEGKKLIGEAAFDAEE